MDELGYVMHIKSVKSFHSFYLCTVPRRERIFVEKKVIRQYSYVFTLVSYSVSDKVVYNV